MEILENVNCRALKNFIYLRLYCTNSFYIPANKPPALKYIEGDPLGADVNICSGQGFTPLYQVGDQRNTVHLN